MKKLLGAPLHVVNIGIASFAEPVRRAGARATQLEWAPPAQGDRAVAPDPGSGLPEVVLDPRHA